MPLISVILPTFNRSQSVAFSIESVLSQSFSDFELCVVDDASVDATKEVLDSFEGGFKSIQLPENGGVSKARNSGINATDSEWVAFLDSDDIWHKEKLEKQISTASERPDHFLHFTDEIWIRNGLRINPKMRHQKREGWIFQPSLELCMMAPSTVMLKRELLEKCGLFDENLQVCEDYDLWLRITREHKILFIDEPLIIKYGGHSDQLSKNIDGIEIYRIHSLEKLLRNIQQWPGVSRTETQIILSSYKD